MASTINANFRTNAVAMLSGYIDGVDPDGGANASLTVGGQVVSASRSAYSQGATIRVVLPNMGSVTYPLWIQPESRGGSPTIDNDISPILIHNKTATGFDIFLEENVGRVQNLRLHVYAFPTGVVTNMVTPSASFVTVDSGEVSMDNLRVRASTNGAGVQIATVSGTMSASVSGYSTYNLNADSIRGGSRFSLALTTTFVSPFTSWAARNANGNETLITLIDRTNKRAYRITTMIESGAGNSFAMIERLA